MKSVHVPWKSWYGNEQFELTFPDTWDVETAAMQDAPDISDEAIRRAFLEPIGTPMLSNLAKGKKTAVIAVDDLSRPTQAYRMIPPLLDELHAGGIQDENIIFIMALGAHRVMMREDLIKKLGSEIVEKFAVYNHNPYENLVSFGNSDLGTPIQVNRFFVEADLKIGVGFITPHPLAGFGGGGKIVLPGLGGIDTLEKNHDAVLTGQFKSGVTIIEGNAQRQDLEDVARKVGLDLIINSVGTSTGGTAGVFVGDLVKAHRKAVELACEVYATKAPREADIGVFNAYPKDTDFIQALNALNVWDLADRMLVKEGGVIVLTTACPEGKGYHMLSSKGMRLYKLSNTSSAHRREITGKRRMIIFSPDVNRYDIYDRVTKDVGFYTRWDDLLGELSKKYPAKCRVAVYPCSTLQYIRR